MVKSKSARARFAEIRNLVKSVTHCGKSGYGCGAPVTKIKVEVKKNIGQVNIVSELQVQTDEETAGEFKKQIIKQILTPEICRDILKNVSDSDCILLGIDPRKSRPESMIHTIFPVSPVAIRPSAKVEFLESSTKEDDLTHKLADIVKINLKLRNFKELSNEIIVKHKKDNTDLLQFYIYTNYDNESAEMPRSELRNKATKSLCSRLKGKDGRINSVQVN
jgi:DNA-directed RNA polymerase II subunit RPB1